MSEMLPTKIQAAKMWAMVLNPDAFPDENDDLIAKIYDMGAEAVFQARADGTLQTRQEFIGDLDRETLWRALPHKPETTEDFHHDPITGVWFVPIEAVEIAALGEQP